MEEVSGETVAWIAVIGTTAGALIGATAGGIVDLFLDRGREKRDAKVGARLVRLDLALAASTLKEAERTLKWWVFFNTAMPGWDAHRVSLAARLGEDDFEVVTQSVAELGRFLADLKQAPLDPGKSYRTLSNPAPLHTMRSNATAAYNALAELAEQRSLPAGKLLHD